MNDNLIGYLLNALDPAEREAFEAEVRKQPKLKSEIESLARFLKPLEADREQLETPKGLFINTLAKIAEHRCPSLPYAPTLPLRPVHGNRSWFRKVDLLAAACLLVVVGGLAMPLLISMRQNYLIKHCENNLRVYGEALQTYGVSHDSKLPHVPINQKHNYSASFVPELHKSGLLANKHLICLGSGDRDNPITSSMVDELDDDQHENMFAQSARHLAGNYAYSLGYMENGKHHGIQRGDGIPIMSDHRPEVTGDLNSPNHGGTGQNVLFADNHVEFLKTPFLTGTKDNIFLNDEGRIKAGLKKLDTVLGSGETRP